MITIKVGGNNYVRFNSIEVVNELGTLPSYFKVTYVYSGVRELPKTLDKYSIKVNNKIVQSGTILGVKVYRDTENEYISFTGTDNTRLLMLQSCGKLPMQENINLTALINKLVAGLSIKVLSKLTAPVIIPRIKVNPSNTVFSTLHKLALKYNFLITTDGTSLVITREGLSDGALKYYTTTNAQGNLVKQSLTKNYNSYYDSFTASSFDYNTELTAHSNKPKS